MTQLKLKAPRLSSFTLRTEGYFVDWPLNLLKTPTLCRVFSDLAQKRYKVWRECYKLWEFCDKVWEITFRVKSNRAEVWLYKAAKRVSLHLRYYQKTPLI